MSEANGTVNRLAGAKRHEWQPLPDKIDLITCVMTYSKFCHCDVMAYTNRITIMPHTNADIVNKIEIAYSYGYPTPRCRNAALLDAKKKGYHFLLMLDDDMRPDMFLGMEDGAVPFVEAALKFMKAHDGPCIVGAPYCGEPPEQKVLVMVDRVQYPDMPDVVGHKLDKYTRDEAAQFTGIQRVAALPTGCILIDTRVVDILEPPWFDYEFADKEETNLASTEDVYFTRNLDWLGIPSYCAWSSWAGHHKRFLTGKPRPTPIDAVPKAIYNAIKGGWVPRGMTESPEVKPPVAVPAAVPVPAAPAVSSSKLLAGLTPVVPSEVCKNGR